MPLNFWSAFRAQLFKSRYSKVSYSKNINMKNINVNNELFSSFAFKFIVGCFCVWLLNSRFNVFHSLYIILKIFVIINESKSNIILKNIIYSDETFCNRAIKSWFLVNNKPIKGLIFFIIWKSFCKNQTYKLF